VRAVFAQRKKRVQRAVMRVDLNPVRAKMAETLVASEHTSVKARINERASRLPSNPARAAKRLLKPVAGLQANALLGLEERSYLDLVQWTGEQAHPLKRGKLDSLDRETAPNVLGTLAKNQQQWLRQVEGTESRYYRAIGSAEALMAKAAQMGQQHRR